MIYLFFLFTVFIVSMMFACLARFLCQIGREIYDIVFSHIVAVGDQSFHIYMLVRYGTVRYGMIRYGLVFWQRFEGLCHKFSIRKYRN